MPNKVDLSIIVPMYNEQEVLEHFFTHIEKVMKQVPQYLYEIICVNDGSKDETLTLLKKYAQKDKRIKIIGFSRNFHKEPALFAGIENCTGRAAVLIDADLQDPPELILQFLQKWEEGYQVVYGKREDRKTDSFIKRGTSAAFYKVYNWMADYPIPYNAGDFRLIDRKVIDAIKKITEKQLFMKGILNWVGFKSIGIPYTRPARVAGKTKWNYWKLWNFALDGITSSTTLPLRIWTYVGSLMAFVSLLYGLYIALRTLIYGIDVPGYASLLVCILFLGGVQFLVLGILGEYIARIQIEVKNRPPYLIDQKINFDSTPVLRKKKASK